MCEVFVIIGANDDMVCNIIFTLIFTAIERAVSETEVN